MFFSIGLLIVIFFVIFKISPVEKAESASVHGAGQIGLLAAIALFGVDYFTSFFYATGEMMSSLHPYGLQKWGYIAVAIIAFTNIIFGGLYMYSLGIFNEGGGSYTAAMRYLSPALSLIVAVVLIQDYIFTIVVSTLSGVGQLLSLRNATGTPWFWQFLIGVALVSINYFLTIRGRGESGRVVFILLGLFVCLTTIMTIGLLIAHHNNYPAAATEVTQPATLVQALYHLLTASMKGLVALSGLEAMSNGIQFVNDEDAGIIQWGKKHLPKLKGLWGFYSGKSGIGRLVQTSFLFYGGLTTFLLASFSIRFNVFDNTNGRTLVGNLAFIGFNQIPGGNILFWAYQILAVALLTSASMTAFQDLQATAWRDVAIGEIPEIVVYRNPKGTFTRSVTAGFIVALVILLLVRGNLSLAVPYYGIGVFMPIMVMGFAIRKHILQNFHGKARTWGSLAAGSAAILSGIVFVGQIVGKWTEGGWVVLISFSVLIVTANLLLISPIGYRAPQQIYRIVREKARVQGSMASIVEWQSLKMQEYRHSLRGRALIMVTRFFELFGIRRPMRYEPLPEIAGEYNDAVHTDSPEAPSLLAQYLQAKPKPSPMVGGAPKETALDDKEEN
jgi:amino acid transporter